MKIWILASASLVAATAFTIPTEAAAEALTASGTSNSSRSGACNMARNNGQRRAEAGGGTVTDFSSCDCSQDSNERWTCSVTVYYRRENYASSSSSRRSSPPARSAPVRPAPPLPSIPPIYMPGVY